MLKVSEAYEKQIRVTKENPDGSSVTAFEKVFDTRDCLINKSFIVSIHPHEFVSDVGVSKMEQAFPEGSKFSTLVVDGNSFRKSEIIILGSFDKYCHLLMESEH